MCHFTRPEQGVHGHLYAWCVKFGPCVCVFVKVSGGLCRRILVGSIIRAACQCAVGTLHRAQTVLTRKRLRGGTCLFCMDVCARAQEDHRAVDTFLGEKSQARLSHKSN